MTKIIAISDCHSQLPSYLPKSDILIMAGDMEPDGNPNSQAQWLSTTFKKWLHKKANHIKHKVFIAGNHTWWTDEVLNESRNKIKGPYTQLVKDLNINLLYNQQIQLEGLTIFGSPYCSKVGEWNYGYTEDDWAINTAMWPQTGIDILITHGPPKGVLDHMLRYNYNIQQLITDYTGSLNLYQYVQKLQPKLHIFGHIHPHFGQKEIQWTDKKTIFVNSAQLNDSHMYVNHPVEIFI